MDIRLDWHCLAFFSLVLTAPAAMPDDSIPEKSTSSVGRTAGNDHVVEDAGVDEGQGVFQASGDLLVGLGGFGDAAGVVMGGLSKR